ncbi:unnamed protein product [Rodentolepis nana]|uniref:Mediator of RNA polymerase II transcription subunit 7 n=1 Tax=Rodentolepis nana TaxID=102285 RepID=A0A0R3TL63_RODNA|nr:unnamed protein product [Rodentolepis nana]
MNKLPDAPSSVSLFPVPPWELIDKYSDSAVSQSTAPQPPPIPISTTYQTFGVPFSTDYLILKPLESFGFRRIYQQNCSRKSELKKLNFSILANYLDLLDILTRDPSSDKRKEKLDHIGQLFINIHHLLNEYRPHQARDLLREMLIYQVKIASDTVHLCEQYLARTNETLCASSQSISCDFLANTCPSSPYSVSFEDLGPELNELLSDVQRNMKTDDPLSRTNVKIDETCDEPAGITESASPLRTLTDHKESLPLAASHLWDLF